MHPISFALLSCTGHYKGVTSEAKHESTWYHLPTFAELLTKYVTRAGIGDAELARRIRISRLTLIRWKEGVTSRPRYREDVVRCADELRLSPEERDELLTAAGFDPVEPADVPATDAAVDSAEVVAEPPVITPRRLRRTLAVSGAAALVVVAALGYFFLLRQEGESNFPVAADGESVILMAPFVNYTGGQQGFNIQGRLTEEVERAVSTAGLANVRVVEWTEPISTEADAVDAALESGADMVIWGEYDSGRVMANFTVPSPTAGSGRRQPTGGGYFVIPCRSPHIHQRGSYRGSAYSGAHGSWPTVPGT